MPDTQDHAESSTEPRLDASAAFDVAEALTVLSWDYGLYAVWSSLEERAQMRPAMGLCFDSLEPASLELYAELEPQAAVADPYSVPDWAADLISRIIDAEPAP